MKRWFGGGTDEPLHTAKLLTRGAQGAAALSLFAVSVPAVSAQPESWHRVGPPIARSRAHLALDDLKRIGGTEYVAWTASNGHNNVVRVAMLDRASQSWVRVGGVVNHDPTRNAGCASLAHGSNGVPWIGWGEADRHGVLQIRAAYFNRKSGRWIEPDGRDWSINYRPPIWSDFYRDEGHGHSFGATCPNLAILGGRPYIAYVNYDGSGEVAPRVVRLARNGHSWRQLIARSEPPTSQGFLGARLAVFNGTLYVAESWGVLSQPQGHVLRLTPRGTWDELGCINCTVDERTGPVDAFTQHAGGPVVLREAEPDNTTPTNDAYVLALRNGEWHVEGGGPLAVSAFGGVLRSVGGRLYVGWSQLIGSRSSGYYRGRMHTSRLSDDGTSWVRLSDPTPLKSYTISALDGVPYVAGTAHTGDRHTLLVEKLRGGPRPLGSDDPEGSGRGRQPNLKTQRVLPLIRHGRCGAEYNGTRYGDGMNFSGYGGPFTVRGRGGADHLRGGRRGDCLYGGSGHDLLAGERGGDRLDGGRGNDGINGGEGNDRLYGGPGNDRLIGGPGNDLLVGGPGEDHIGGGSGDDTIKAADGERDRVYCGPGGDTVIADRSDQLSGCEHVTFR